MKKYADINMNRNIQCIHKPKWKWWNLFYPIIFNYEEENFECEKCDEMIQRKFPLTQYERILHSGAVFFLALIATVLINLPFMTTTITSRKMCIIILIETLLTTQPFIRAFMRLFQYKFVKYDVIQSQSCFHNCDCKMRKKNKKHIPKIGIKDFFLIFIGSMHETVFVCKSCKKSIELKNVSIAEYNRKTFVFWAHFLILYFVISKTILFNLVPISVLTTILNIAMFILAQIILVYLYETRAFEFVALHE